MKSEKTHARLDESRERKAHKIVAVLGDALAGKALDIGTGSGHIAAALAKKASVWSVDVTDERIIKNGYKFLKVKDEHLLFRDETFDVVVSNQVIEHVPQQMLHLQEIHRVLKKGGVCYLATPNRFFPMEPHHVLPFLSWLPRPAARWLLSIMRGKHWDIYPLSYGKLNRMASGGFIAENATLRMLKSPKKYGLDGFPLIQPLLSALPLVVLKLLNPFLPSYVLILQKK